MELRPGAPGYGDLLPVARAHPVGSENPPERQVDPDTLAGILRDAGPDRPDERETPLSV